MQKNTPFVPTFIFTVLLLFIITSTVKSVQSPAWLEAYVRLLRFSDDEVAAANQKGVVNSLVNSVEAQFKNPDSRGHHLTDTTVGYQLAKNMLLVDLQRARKLPSMTNVQQKLLKQELASDCVSCHMMFAKAVAPKAIQSTTTLPPTSQTVDLLLSLRRYKTAENILLDRLAREENTGKFTMVKKLVLLAASKNSRDRSKRRILQAIKGVKLASYPRRQVQEWVRGLNNNANYLNWETAQNFLRSELGTHNSTAKEKDKIWNGSKEVFALTSTATIHHHLLKTSAKATGLDLLALGHSYLQLSNFFPRTIGEKFLRNCIELYPNSKEAERAYGLLQSSVVFRFTGSQGTKIPESLKRSLHDLKQLAVKDNP